ncbi:hypothetical protein MKX03_019099, partial [Papaver bracteatum]
MIAFSTLEIHGSSYLRYFIIITIVHHIYVYNGLYVKADQGAPFFIPKSAILENPFTNLLLCFCLPDSIINERAALSWSRVVLEFSDQCILFCAVACRSGAWIFERSLSFTERTR